jgi:hypothetical protein
LILVYLPAAFQFALKIGKFFALTAFNYLNSNLNNDATNKKCKPSAVDLKTMFFSKSYILKVLNLMISFGQNKDKNLRYLENC